MVRALPRLVFNVTKVLLKSFRKSIEQEIQLSKEAAKIRYSERETAKTAEAQQMSVAEAELILHADKGNPTEIEKKFQHLFEANSRERGGSFYLQSKVVRAKEILDSEMKKMPCDKK